MSSKTSVTLKFREEKKHSVRYDVTTSDAPTYPIVTSVYILKSGITNELGLPSGTFPKRLQLTVSMEEGEV